MSSRIKCRFYPESVLDITCVFFCEDAIIFKGLRKIPLETRNELHQLLFSNCSNFVSRESILGSRDGECLCALSCRDYRFI